MRKLKIFQNTIIVVMSLLAALNIYFIVRSIMMTPTVENVGNHVLFIVCLFLLLALIGLNIGNTIFSKKNGSTFLRPLAFEIDGSLNTKFIVFCCIWMAIAIACIVYFLLILFGVELYFSTFPRPLLYLIVNLLLLTLADAIFIVLFPVFGREDPSFYKKKNKY